MATINLAPGTQYLAIVRRRRRILFLFSGFIAVVVALAWLTLVFITRSTETKLQQTESQLRSIETQIAQLKQDEERIKAFEARLVALDSLLKTHVSWTPMLKEIERLLPAPIVLSNIKANFENGEVILSGTAPDIDQVAQALASVSNSPDHATIFNKAQLRSIRQKSTAVEGQPSTTVYEFDAQLSFLKSAVQTNNVASR